MSTILSVNKLKKSYKDGRKTIEVLRGVSFSVDKGEWISVMGPSGSGKTTLLNMIGLLDKNDEGDILLEDVDIQGLKPNQKARIRSNKITIVFQNHFLVPTMTVRENVELPFIWSDEKITTEEMKERALGAIELVGLKERADYFPDELSGGEKQRTSIARAIVNKPPLILLDEPTGNLDTQTGKAILGIFRKIVSLGETSLIMVTHDPEAAKVSDRVLLLKQGKLVDL